MNEIESDMRETLITLTSDIVAAHVSNNSVAVSDLPVLISNVYSALAGLNPSQPAPEPLPEPAVSIRSSIKNDHIVCLEDGKKLKMLKRHLMTRYGMTPDQYRQRWNLPADYPMVAPAYAEKRRELAKKIGLGRKPAAAPKRVGRPPKAPAGTIAWRGAALWPRSAALARRAPPDLSAPGSERTAAGCVRKITPAFIIPAFKHTCRG
jgi:predicted transcriptional regulator